LYCLPNIVTLVKLRKKRQACAACVEEMRNAYKFVGGKPQRNKARGMLRCS